MNLKAALDEIEKDPVMNLITKDKLKSVLVKLFGKDENKTGRWVPKEGEVFWYIDGDGNLCSDTKVTSIWQDNLIKNYNCYPTEEIAEEEAKALLEFRKRRALERGV